MPYKNIEIPDDTDPEDYTYHERRAELFNFIIEAGHPDLLSRKKFAEYYGVAPSTITKDIQKLRAEIRDELGTDAEFITEVVYTKAIREKVKEEDWEAATEIVDRWNGWLFETGAQERAPEKQEIEQTIRQESNATDDYELITDDDAVAEADAPEQESE